ncbi:hypothetical protein LCGC14_2597150, partial [marine sediment metagenome]
IKALGDNEWLILPAPAADPKWGVARGRAWGSRQAYAPDLGGAFFCGTGIHGFVKPNGQYMDDLWFYDINQNRWICLYPGAHCKTLKLKLDKHGFEINDRGEHVPVSYLSHTYGNVTYLPGVRKYLIIYKNCFWWTRAIPQRCEWLGVPPDKRGPYNNGNRIDLSARHPLLWDVKTGKWERRYVAGEQGPPQEKPGQTKYWNIGLVQYIPFLKKTFVTMGSKTWLYDHRSNTWADVKVARDPDIPWNHYTLIPQLGCLDTKRRRLYTAASKRFLYFDFANSRWVKVQAEGQPVFGNSNSAALHYDTAGDVVICHQAPRKSGKRFGDMYVYAPEQNTWTRPENTFPVSVRTKYMGQHGFYVPGLNAHFFYIAGDSANKRATMLAYRYKVAGR